MKGFIDFIRKQGIVGLAVGFILGGEISKLISTFLADIVNPLLGLVLGTAKDLQSFSLSIGNVQIKIGDFIRQILNFILIALIVYMAVNVLKVDRLDKKKE